MVFRDRPNSRAACRMLMPSTCTARLTRAYTSTLYTSRCPTKHNFPVMFWTETVVVYFGTATKPRSRGVLWSIIAPPFIGQHVQVGIAIPLVVNVHVHGHS